MQRHAQHNNETENWLFFHSFISFLKAADLASEILDSVLTYFVVTY